MLEDPKFGTDGVRGVANADLTPFFAFRLGRVTGDLLKKSSPGRPLLIGRDTRISGDMLQAALTAGVLSTGVNVLDLGIIPTPGVALLTRTRCAAAGAVISASHNPAKDNGIKFFGPDGRKLADETETEIERRLGEFDRCGSPTGAGVGRLIPGTGLQDEYLRFLVESAPCRLDGMRVVIDCGCGAASELAPQVARALGADVVAAANEPDGLNINAGSGALHPELAQRLVREHTADLAVSFDGDADRAIFADESGHLVDGDRVMAMCAIAWKGTDSLAGDQVVGTVMSNIGLELGLAERGIRLLRAPVGDRFVAELMRSEGAVLGGEKSGHILFARLHTTGDGILTFVQVACLVRQAGSPLSELAGAIREYPQVLVNVPVWRRRGWREQPDLWAAVKSGESRLNGSGRILVRASGTERIIRVMAEGPDHATVSDIVDHIAGVVRDRMGSPQAEAAD
jgi:phosphoglucosamine mutase